MADLAIVETALEDAQGAKEARKRGEGEEGSSNAFSFLLFRRDWQRRFSTFGPLSLARFFLNLDLPPNPFHNPPKIRPGHRRRRPGRQTRLPLP